MPSNMVEFFLCQLASLFFGCVPTWGTGETMLRLDFKQVINLSFLLSCYLVVFLNVSDKICSTFRLRHVLQLFVNSMGNGQLEV